MKSNQLLAARPVSPVQPPRSDAEILRERISLLYGLSQKSNYVFGSPLGPLFHQGRHFSLPRFVYFGPHTHDDSLRLAFLAGLEASDFRASLLLTHFVEHLATAPNLGQGLNLSFFPLVDVLGNAGAGEGRQLAGEGWMDTTQPEIQALRSETRVRAFHGFVTLETAADAEAICVGVRVAGKDAPVPVGIEFVTSEEFAPWPVRWEASARDQRILGPLSLSEDLPFSPFELSIRFPRHWPEEQHRAAVIAVLSRFILRHSALQAYSQHL